MPPRRTEPVSRGWNGSATSYCLSSPVPQQDTYSQRSSTDRSMSVISGGTAPKGCSAGGSRSWSAGSAGIVISLRAAQRFPLPVPEEYRGGEVLDADGGADKAPGLGRVMGWAQLEHDLVGVAQVDALGEAALAHAPEVQVVTKAAPQQVLGVEAVLEHGRCAPFGGDDSVVVEVPPDVVGEELLAAVALPGPDDVEAVVVEQGDPAGAVVAVGPAEGGKEDGAGPAVDGVGPGVAGLGGQLLGWDLPDHRGGQGIGPGVQHVDPRGADAGDDQVAALQRPAVAAVALMAEGGRAGVPAEVVQFVAGRGQLAPADHLPEVVRGLIDIDHRHGVLGPAGRVERGHVGQPLRRRSNRLGRAAVERRIGRVRHDLPPVNARAFVSGAAVVLPKLLQVLLTSCMDGRLRPGQHAGSQIIGTRASQG